jgi:hypothetical protein
MPMDRSVRNVGMKGLKLNLRADMIAAMNLN